MNEQLSTRKLFAAPIFSLFTSAGTLVCCAFPALFVSLGAGATLVSLLARFPQLIWLSEHKGILFSTAIIGLTLGGVSQWRAKNLPCPINPELAKTCMSARKWSKYLYIGSVTLFLIGVSFAYIVPALSE